jgi:GntR family transcriptional regulator
VRVQGNFSDPPPIRSDEAAYSQIADHIRRQVALSVLHPGERLPAIRAMAVRLGLDPGTVARAYRELESEGIVVGRHGGGSYISAKLTEGYLALQQQSRLSLIAERYILEALALGCTTEEIAGVFTAHLADWRERRSQSAGRKRRNAKRGNEVRFMGSHDVAMELLASQVRTVFPEVNLATTFVGSLAGLVAVECRQAGITSLSCASLCLTRRWS